MCWLKEGAGNEKKISSDYFDQISFIQTYMSTTDCRTSLKIGFVIQYS